MKVLNIPKLKKIRQSLRHFEKNHKALRRLLIILITLWFFVVVGFLIWYMTDPYVLLPNSSEVHINRVKNIERIKEEEKTKPKTKKILPNIEKFSGKPNFTKNIDKFDKFLKRAAEKYNLDCTYVKAYMMAESQGDPKAKSWVGAVGLMQLMPATAKAMGYSTKLTDPLTSIMAGAKYISHLETTCCHEKPRNAVCDPKEDIKYHIAAYNGGSRCNKPATYKSCLGQTNWECEINDGYDETRHYVDKVKANYNHLKKNGWGC